MTTFKYKDFLPQQTKRDSFFGGVDFAGFDSCVEEMNQWLKANPVDIQRIETVVLPNIFNPIEEGPTDTELLSSGHTLWYQFVRLWFS